MAPRGASGLRCLLIIFAAFLPVLEALSSQQVDPLAILKRQSPSNVQTQIGGPSLAELFGMYDVDSDGYLQPLELVLLLQRPAQINVVDRFVHRLKLVFTASEANGDGKLDLAELTGASSKPSRSPNHFEASGAFELFDENGDHLLNRAEVATAVQRMTGTALSSDRIEEMFSRTDANGDGTVDKVEFTDAMRVQEQTGTSF